MLFRQSILAITLTLSFLNVFAYEQDYMLDGRFLIEVTNGTSKNPDLEIWDIFLQRGMIDSKQHFIDFELVSIDIGKSKKNEYRIRSIDILYDRYKEGKLNFYGADFIAEWGTVLKWTIRISFNKDGSLKSISGVKTDKFDPQNTKTFSLVESVTRFNIDEINNFPHKKYLYQKK